MKLHCPHCGQKYEIDDSCIGKRAECEICHNDFKIEQPIDAIAQELEAMQFKNCPYCGEKILSVAKKCKHCGEFLEPQYRPQAVPANVIPVYHAQQKSRAVYVLLGLFFGLLGIHNFYAGYNGPGAAQLILTLLLCWTVIVPVIIALIVLVEILTTTKDCSGVPFC